MVDNTSPLQNGDDKGAVVKTQNYYCTCAVLSNFKDKVYIYIGGSEAGRGSPKACKAGAHTVPMQALDPKLPRPRTEHACECVWNYQT